MVEKRIHQSSNGWWWGKFILREDSPPSIVVQFHDHNRERLEEAMDTFAALFTEAALKKLGEEKK